MLEPTGFGPDADRGERHRHYRREAVVRDVERYAEVQGLEMRGLFRDPDARVAAMGLLAALATGAHLARVPGNMEMIARYNAGDPYAGYSPAWRNFFGAAEWVEANTPPDAVVTVRKPRLFNALTDRQVMLYPYTSDTDSVLSIVRETDFVFLDALFPTTQRYLLPALRQNPDDYYLAHQTEAPVTMVLGVRDDRTPNP